jgi:outer membrane immunogenic protein
LNLISGGAKISGVESGNAFSFDSVGGKQTQGVSVDVSYGLSLGGSSVLTIGLDADLSDAKLATFTDADTVNGFNVEVKQKNRYGVYVAPGIAVTKDALIYGKLGYNSMKGELSFDAGSVSQTFKGVSYGVGTKIMISKNTFFKVEASRYTYSSKTTDDGTSVKPSATVGTIGFGIKF